MEGYYKGSERRGIGSVFHQLCPRCTNLTLVVISYNIKTTRQRLASLISHEITTRVRSSIYLYQILWKYLQRFLFFKGLLGGGGGRGVKVTHPLSPRRTPSSNVLLLLSRKSCNFDDLKTWLSCAEPGHEALMLVKIPEVRYKYRNINGGGIFTRLLFFKGHWRF